MTRKTTVTSDISGEEIDYDTSYGLTLTNRSTKMSAKFDISHNEVMDLIKAKNLKPNWLPWSDNRNF